MVENWVKLSNFLHSDQSMVKPDGWPYRDRIVVMDYESTESRMHRDTVQAQGSRFVVRADVANCFPSIYSHAIDWALRGKAVAKKDKVKSSWEPKLDELLRNCHDRETKGAMIGPVISNIAAEVILQRVDADLVAAGFEFTRYVDDFTSYHVTLEEAERFVAQLDRSLAHYRLQLNTRKTRISSLAEDSDSDWITEVLMALPRKKRAGAVESLRFLRHCEASARRHPQRSVLTFGIKTLLGKRGCPQVGVDSKRAPNPTVDLAILDELFRLTFLYPHLIPYATRQLAYCSELLSKAERERLAHNLRVVLAQAATRRETSTICWGIYAIRKILKRSVVKNLAMALIETDDDLVWLALAASGKKYVPWVLGRMSSLIANGAHECLDHWLMRYELYRIKELKSHQLDNSVESWFVKARPAGLRFSILE
ncbi:RNA-directed DNA polymerase [Tessaracoccus defluvii]|uniref:RNA-directed DNA polymerase n=1 Tax=Tessaracoccus defluvii TaxID=1285901 RepID=A0A7H0H5M9_9ACTN|nr:RNA-directed DNA polymerase [Tessaracoccus defluvii]QNP55845.1 RNA-directed DNA polymerase [Tessaracoccus defluvii]